jgi:hypothetical protein
MAKPITQYLHLDQVTAEEVPQVLMSYFGHASLAGTTITVSKQDSQEHYIELHFNKSGTQIVKALASDSITRDTLREIDDLIVNSLIANQHHAFGQAIAMAGAKVTGYFRYKDIFQILPVPSTAPHAVAATGHHPFILQFAYTSCPNAMISGSRQMRLAAKYIRLLNMLVDLPVYLPSNTGEYQWVWSSDESSEPRSEYRATGYVYPGMLPVIDSLSPVSDTQVIEYQPFQSYYTRLGHTYRSLDLPDNLELSLDRALSLSENEWLRFYMACVWFAQGRKLWTESPSSAFIGLVIAMECLVDKPEQCIDCHQPTAIATERCSTCGQPKFEITKHFRAFLEEHVPFLAEPDWAQIRNRLYRVRSELAHGLDLLMRDLDPSFQINVRAAEQDHLQRNLHFLTRIAILNWLHSNRRTMSPSP